MIKLRSEDLIQIATDRGLVIFFHYLGSDTYVIYTNSGGLEAYSVIPTKEFNELKIKQSNSGLRLVEMLNNPTPEPYLFGVNSGANEAQ